MDKASHEALLTALIKEEDPTIRADTAEKLRADYDTEVINRPGIVETAEYQTLNEKYNTLKDRYIERFTSPPLTPPPDTTVIKPGENTPEKFEDLFKEG